MNPANMMTHPSPNPARPRTLKIEPFGDPAKGKVKPFIRLCGRWLELAGFKPGHRVQVHLLQEGVLTLTFTRAASDDALSENMT